MKIVYLIAGTFNSGGMERVLANKANWLVEHGYDVSVVTTDQRGRSPYFKMDDRILHYDLDINYDDSNGKSFLRKTISFYRKQRQHRQRLTKLLTSLHADITVCMFNNDAPFVYKIHDGSRKVLEVHFSKNKKLQYGRHGLWALADRWRTRQEERYVSRYDRFVVLTKEDKALWDGASHRSPLTSRITVIPNARTFVPRQQSPLVNKRVVAIGRYDYQKGFDTLLYIWHLLSDRLNGWTLDIIGDGPLRQEMTWQLYQWHLTESVRLLPPTGDMASVYRDASVLAMTSRYEGLPMVLLEAQACGLPIVSFACQCGPRDVITDGVDGYLIEDRDEHLFADRLFTLMNDEALRQRMGSAALKSSQRYSEDTIMQQWDTLFKVTRKS